MEDFKQRPKRQLNNHSVNIKAKCAEQGDFQYIVNFLNRKYRYSSADTQISHDIGLVRFHIFAKNNPHWGLSQHEFSDVGPVC